MQERRIRRVRRDGQELAILSYAIVVPPHGALTKAESEVARLVAKGMSNREIAATRATTERTVANQLRSIFTKFGIQSRVELVMLLV
jgi:DNA-binding CsgD family transcriptional regulator